MEGTSGDHAVIDIENPLPSSFRNLMADKLTSSPNSCIFRTPINLTRHNEQAYKPKAFSFGPFHYGSQQSKSTQKIKLEYLRGLLSRSKSPEELYKKLIETIKSVQKEARECYEGSIESRKEEVLLDILVLDGCFIIELFHKAAGVVSPDRDDPIFSRPYLQECLLTDLILLENQIPWLVLERLFHLTKLSEDKNLIELALYYLRYILSAKRLKIPNQSKNLRIKHILDLLRHSLILPVEDYLDKDFSYQNSIWEPLPCATEIYESGSIRRRQEANSVLDVRFRNGALEIPPLFIQEITETIFRNLITFEQCCPNYEPVVTSYVRFMDNIINTDDDVMLLTKNDILDTWLNPQDVRKVFKYLYSDAYVTGSYYGNICKEVTCHRKRWRTRFHYFYVHNYFGKPLGIVSQIVATIFLVLTFLQTYYTILGGVKEK